MRISYWDNVKGVLIFLVVLGHFLDLYIKYSSSFRGMHLFIYTFHMPLFIFVAGYFHKNEKVVSKVIFYTLCGFLSKFFIYTSKWLTGNPAKLNIFVEGGLPWFMFAIAAFIYITFLTKDINVKFLIVMAVILSCYVGYDRSVGDYFVLSRIFVFYPFFLMGCFCRKNRRFVDMVMDPSKKITYISSIFLIVYLIVCLTNLFGVCDLIGYFKGRFSYKGDYWEFGAGIRLFLYVFISFVGFSFLCVIPKKRIPIFNDFGISSLQIYFWHYLFIFILVNMGVTYLCETNLGRIAFISMSFLLTVLLSYSFFSFPLSVVKRYCLSKK